MKLNQLKGNKMIEIKAPNSLPLLNRPSIFLAGSIEMGKAEHWQDKLINDLSNQECICFNPRRESWDNTWIQSIDNPQFSEQVNWELTCLEKSDLVVFYFDPSTKSPITLLELGLFANTEKNVVVFCPDGFFRKGNVDIVCSRYAVPQVNSYEELVYFVSSFLKKNQLRFTPKS